MRTVEVADLINDLSEIGRNVLSLLDIDISLDDGDTVVEHAFLVPEAIAQLGVQEFHFSVRNTHTQDGLTSLLILTDPREGYEFRLHVVDEGSEDDDENVVEEFRYKRTHSAVAQASVGGFPLQSVSDEAWSDAEATHEAIPFYVLMRFCQALQKIHYALDKATSLDQVVEIYSVE